MSGAGGVPSPPEGPAPERPPGASGPYGSFQGGEAEPARDAEDPFQLAGQNLEDLGPIMSGLERIGLFRSDSMEMSNDPRFFQGSVLNKRMAAFSGLGVVSGLMVGFTQASLRKDFNMDLTTIEGQLYGIGFIVSCVGLFSNIIATYVSVAQVYHVYRLETAGPMGFEMATSYYLNPNIVAWRHLAIKCLLLSLPLFLVSTGLQIEVSMGSSARVAERPSLRMARAWGFTMMSLFFFMGLVVWYVHSIHAWIFRDRYDVAMDNQTPYLNRVASMQSSARSKRAGNQLDV